MGAQEIILLAFACIATWLVCWSADLRCTIDAWGYFAKAGNLDHLSAFMKGRDYSCEALADGSYRHTWRFR